MIKAPSLPGWERERFRGLGALASASHASGPDGGPIEAGLHGNFAVDFGAQGYLLPKSSRSRESIKSVKADIPLQFFLPDLRAWLGGLGVACGLTGRLAFLVQLDSCLVQHGLIGEYGNLGPHG